MHAQGIVIGQGNAISGTNHVAIGQNLEGFYNNAVQIGSTNLNKLYFDNSEIVFEPNIPELQFFTGSEKKIVIGTKSELTDTAGSAGFTMEFSNTTHATPDNPSRYLFPN